MARRLYECDTCGEQHTSILGMMFCCEPALPDIEDNPDIILTSD